MKLYQVDAFTDKPFGGNPAAVCLLRNEVSPDWMQQVAAEMNLSETAFLTPRDGGFDLRWFTPVIEVPLCGHATLASAHALWESGVVASGEPIRFFTASGELRATAANDLIWLDLPSRTTHAKPLTERMRRAIGTPCTWEGVAGEAIFVELASEDELRLLNPDLGILRTDAPDGLIATARADQPSIDFVSRYFVPAAGIDEDPVTGSAHCSLAPYWAAKLDRDSMRARQISRRGGELHVRVTGDRVMVGGSAVTVLRGELL